jgi:hypothetical protein
VICDKKRRATRHVIHVDSRETLRTSSSFLVASKNEDTLPTSVLLPLLKNGTAQPPRIRDFSRQCLRATCAKLSLELVHGKENLVREARGSSHHDMSTIVE